MTSIIKVLNASHGDSIIIETIDSGKKKFVILIDGGTAQTFKTVLLRELLNYKQIDLIILTHIDDDHIGGLLALLKSDLGKKIKFKKMLVNAPNLARIKTGTQISYGQGIDLEKFIYENYSNLHIITNLTNEIDASVLNLPEGIEMDILSPNALALNAFYKKYPIEYFEQKKAGNPQISASTTPKAKDFNKTLVALTAEKENEKTIASDVVNASSLAFTLRTPHFYGLFLGDSHAKIICESFKKKGISQTILFDFIKLSHHGSKNNISSELFSYIKSDTVIISTNGGEGRAKHPDRKALAKVVTSPSRVTTAINFCFNYPLNEVQDKTGLLVAEEEKESFNFQMIEKNKFVFP